MDIAFARNLPKSAPEDIFEADAGLVMADHNRAFYNSGLAASVVKIVVDRFERTVIVTMDRHGIPSNGVSGSRLYRMVVFSHEQPVLFLDTCIVCLSLNIA